MKILSYFFLSVFFFVYALAIDEQVEKANNFCDLCIETATNDAGDFSDSLPLDELSKTFEREIGFVRMRGEAKLYDGKINGLSSLKRKGDAVVLDLDDVLIVSCQMTFKKINASYKGALLLNDAGPKFSVNAKVGSSKATMILMVPSEGGNATVVSFNINKLQDIRISISGLGPWGWAASIISTLALNALEQPVAKAASLKVFEHFSKEIEKVPYPGNGTE